MGTWNCITYRAHDEGHCHSDRATGSCSAWLLDCAPAVLVLEASVTLCKESQIQGNGLKWEYFDAFWNEQGWLSGTALTPQLGGGPVIVD
jgi:hypothetical protein